MPGLTGIIKNQGNTVDIEQLLSKMCQILKHEDWYKIDTFSDESIGFGRVSLGILNPEPQPIFNKNKNLCIMMEGEIYDYQDLKDELISKGHKFSVNNDPEFILHLYEEYGKDFANKLNGSFIIAIWDKDLKTLLILNDRYGFRPVYYSEHNGYLLFGSEAKSILQDKTFEIVVDDRAVSDFFSFGYILDNKTFFLGIELLPPASMMMYSSGEVSIEEYWSFDFNEENEVQPESFYVDIFSKYLLKSVERCTKGNYRVGIPLSGGLDSRMIVSSIDKKHYPIHTFTFGKSNCDDAKFANMVANKLGTDHHFFEFKSDDIISYAERSVYLTEGMLNCIHAHGTQTIDDMKKYVDVVFSGVEAIHIWYSVADMNTLINNYRKSNNDNVLFQLMFTPLSYDDRINSTKIRDKLFSKSYYSKINSFPSDSLRNLEENISKKHNEISIFKRIDYYNLRQRQRRFTSYGLVLMRSKIEVRTPLFDNDLMDFIFALPPKLRAEDKTIYIDTILSIFPQLESIPWQKTGLPVKASRTNKKLYRFYRYGKSGVNMVLQKVGLPAMFKENFSYASYDEWMQHDTKLKNYIYEIVLSEKSLNRGYFNPDFLRKIVEDQISGKKNHVHLIGLLLTFELFNRMFIDGEKI